MIRLGMTSKPVGVFAAAGSCSGGDCYSVEMNLRFSGNPALGVLNGGSLCPKCWR